MKKNLILLIVVTIAGLGFAATTYDLSKGNVTVPDNTTAIITQPNRKVSLKNSVTIGTNCTVTLSGVNFAGDGSYAGRCCVVGRNSSLILDNAAITNINSGVAIYFAGNSHLILADGTDNHVYGDGEYPGIFWARGRLNIKGQTKKNGKLTVSSRCGCAIGAKDGSGGTAVGAGSLVIESGNIIATSSSYSPAIGGGDGRCSSITIKGGTVNAYCSSSGAGIGGNCGGITISGGTVIAKSRIGTGIGNSYYGSGCGNIAISGGNVTATGGSNAAGIGSCGPLSSACGSISITGGTVTAKGGSGAAGIGAGGDYYGSECGAITIADTVEKVTVTKGGSDVLSYIGKSASNSTVGTVTIGSKLQKTLSNNNLTQTLTPAYTITWKDSNGTTLEKDTLVLRGTTPTYNGATPTKASTAQYSYAFVGWSPAVTAATADKTYTATYTQTVRSYKVTWKDDDGTTLKTDTLLYGDIPDYGDAPTKESTAQYSYTFAGWSPSIVAVTGAATYTATYDTTERIPDIDDDASEEAVNAAVDFANFADAAVKAVIGGNASEYRAFKTWASEVAGGEAAVVASTNAAVSYMLGAERLFVNAPEIEFGECEVATDTGEVVISITVKDGEDAVAVASEKVKEMFEATSDLNDWYSAGKRLVPVVTDLSQGQSSILRFRVLPGDGTSPSAFLRIRK